MSELTDDQKRSIEMTDQKDLSQDDHAGIEPQGETFRERIAGLKDSVSEKASDLKNSIQDTASDLKGTVSEKVSDLKNSIQDTASNLNRKTVGYMFTAGLAASTFNIADRIEMSKQYETSTQIAAHYREDPQVHIEAPVKAPDMPPAADTTDERLVELASSMVEVNKGVEPGPGSQTETGQLYTGPGLETWRQIVLKDGTTVKLGFPEKKSE